MENRNIIKAGAEVRNQMKNHFALPHIIGTSMNSTIFASYEATFGNSAV
jgi:hypothetical protein